MEHMALDPLLCLHENESLPLNWTHIALSACVSMWWASVLAAHDLTEHHCLHFNAQQWIRPHLIMILKYCVLWSLFNELTVNAFLQIPYGCSSTASQVRSYFAGKLIETGSNNSNWICLDVAELYSIDSKLTLVSGCSAQSPLIASSTGYCVQFEFLWFCGGLVFEPGIWSFYTLQCLNTDFLVEQRINRT